jgi:4-diphosphocytidyl-2-C-methyl-D-erythritol kinase
MRVVARAKVTLALDVLGRRDDGWHDVDIVLHRIPWGDRIEIRPAGEPALRVEGTGVDAGVDNLAWRALAAVAEIVGGWPPVEVRLAKRVPVGAGLGGGSADAAAVLEWACRRYPARAPAIRRVAAQLGKDVPFLMDGRAARATGLGETLEPLPALPGSLVVAFPGYPVSTAAVYAAVDAVGPSGPRLAGAVVDALQSGMIPSQVGNQLEGAAWRVEPRLLAFRDQLLRCGAPPHLTTLSGSGASYVVVCPDRREALSLARRLRRNGVPWVRVMAPPSKRG